MAAFGKILQPLFCTRGYNYGEEKWWLVFYRVIREDCQMSMFFWIHKSIDQNDRIKIKKAEENEASTNGAE